LGENRSRRKTEVMGRGTKKGKIERARGEIEKKDIFIVGALSRQREGRKCRRSEGENPKAVKNHQRKKRAVFLGAGNFPRQKRTDAAKPKGRMGISSCDRRGFRRITYKLKEGSKGKEGGKEEDDD